MLLRCERSRMFAEQVAALTVQSAVPPSLWESQFAVEPGQVYEPLGMYLQYGVMWVYVLDEFDRVRPAPLPLFSVIDGQVPSTWRVSVEQNGTVVFFAPPEASDLYFADRVEQCEPLALASLRRIARLKSPRDDSTA